ncbi:MAG: HupE/UreJ family protein, partial [Dokdonella sp.]
MSRLSPSRRWLDTALIVFGCLFAFAAMPALAHKASDAYLTIRADAAAKGSYEGQWDIALRDLDAAIAIDGNGDRTLTWGEIRIARPRIERYAFDRLAIAATSKCSLMPNDLLIDRHSDGHYAVLRFGMACPQATDIARIDYRLMQGIDSTHRGLLQWIDAGGAVQSAVLIPGEPRDISLLQPSRWSQFKQYLWDGAHHIWIGYDHMLFLISLLLPAVLIRRRRDWIAAESGRAVAMKVAGIVTAFTLAHSITLTLAALGFVQLPSRLVESAIALSVILAAINNIKPLVTERTWAFAFGFGLLHGFGFASALADLGLPRDALALCLLAFNLGVEFGQLCVVAVLLPIAFLLRRSVFYRR